MENQSDEAQATPWDFGDVSAELELIENATDRAPNNILLLLHTLLFQLEGSGVLKQDNINQINQYLSNNNDNRIKFNTLLSIIYEDLYGYYIQIIEDVEWERPVTVDFNEFFINTVLLQFFTPDCIGQFNYSRNSRLRFSIKDSRFNIQLQRFFIRRNVSDDMALYDDIEDHDALEDETIEEYKTIFTTVLKRYKRRVALRNPN